MTKRDWDKIDKGIKSGMYKLVRLVKITDESNPEITVPFNKITGQSGGALERFEYIRSKIDQLKPGHYQIQCRLSPNNQGITDCYDIVIKTRDVTLTNGIEDHTNKQEEMSTVDFEDYVRLIKENASLTAMNTMLETEKEFYKKEYLSLRDAGVTKSTGLNDSGEKEKGTMEIVASTLENCFAGAMPILQEHFNIQREKIDLQKQQLSSGRIKTNKTMGVKKKLKTIEELAEEKADELYEISETDPEEFENQLDELEANDNELYQLVCEILEIEESEEEEETE